MKKTIVMYTQVELDTETGATRVLKHWQTIPSFKKKVSEIVADKGEEEYME